MKLLGHSIFTDSYELTYTFTLYT